LKTFSRRSTTIRAIKWTPDTLDPNVMPWQFGCGVVTTDEGAKIIKPGEYLVDDRGSLSVVSTADFDSLYDPESIDIDPTDGPAFLLARLRFMRIRWQTGHVKDVGVNGCLLEDVLRTCVARLTEHQLGPLGCFENDEAIRAIEAALTSLGSRRQIRETQGVANTDRPHA